MSLCVSHWTVKPVSSLFAAVPLGLALVFTSADPAKAQFADEPSTSQPSQPPQEQTSNVQTDEVLQPSEQAGLTMIVQEDGSWAIAQFTPTPEPSDPSGPLPPTSV